MAALTPNQLDMIRAIASNDMPRARKAAQAALAEDESKKNYWDVGELKRMLDPSMNPWLAEVPYEIKGLIEVERPAESFIVERYWLSPREKEAFDHIVTMQSVCGKLAQMRVSYPNSTLLYGPERHRQDQPSGAMSLASSFALLLHELRTRHGQPPGRHSEKCRQGVRLRALGALRSHAGRDRRHLCAKTQCRQRRWQSSTA